MVGYSFGVIIDFIIYKTHIEPFSIIFVYLYLHVFIEDNGIFKAISNLFFVILS
jgi:hypothetical protein